MTTKALLVGAGGMGRAWGKNLKEHPEVEIAGWVDIRPGAAQEAADGLQLCMIMVRSTQLSAVLAGA